MAAGDLDAAVRLYEWNLETSAEFYKCLAVTEVVLRNAIFKRKLELDYRDCLMVIGAVCPVTARWTEGQSRVPQVLAVRPPV